MEENMDEVHEFIIPYSELNLEVYNEAYFNKMGVTAEISVVMDTNVMKGGAHSYESILQMEKGDTQITVPYKFFHYRLKYLFGDLFSNNVGENAFTKTFTTASVYGKHILDSIGASVKETTNKGINTFKEKTATIESPFTYGNKEKQEEPKIEPSPEPIPEPVDEAPEKKESEQKSTKEPEEPEEPEEKKDWFPFINWFRFDDKQELNKEQLMETITKMNHIKIKIYGRKTSIDLNNYYDIVQYIKIIHNLHIKQLSIAEIGTVKINNVIIVIGNIIKKEETTESIFKKSIFKDISLKKFENTEAHKLLFFDS